MIDLASVRLFAGLEKHEVSAILAAASMRRYKASETIINAQRPATHLILLKKGCVNFCIASEKGRRILLRRLVPGNAFGIASFLSEPMGYLGTAMAVHSVEVLVWEHRNVRQFARAYPRLMENALRIALHYIAVYAQRHVSLASDTAQERLAFALTDVASRAGHALSSGMEVDIKNEDLAALADVSLFTTSRLLKRWARAGAVEKSRGRVVIQCPERLLAEEAASPEDGHWSRARAKIARAG